MVYSLIYPHGLTGRTIRLLTVEPDDLLAPLRCNLSEICLNTGPTPYHALSYCWGANDSPVQITCNSHPLLVTPNLRSVLIEYRRRGNETPLWVDAICINQSNISERTSQVRMMDEIYTKASCVIVWLGEAEATDGLALNFLEIIQAQLSAASRESIPVLDTGDDALALDAQLCPQLPQPVFEALAAFLLRPWFSRVWIIQEVLLACRVVMWCGPTTLNEEFPILEAVARSSQMNNCMIRTQAAIMASENSEVRRVGNFKLQCATSLFSIEFARENATSGALLCLLIITRWFDATDRRDKIFALANLTSDIDKSFADYSKSYEDVIKELSLMFLDGRIEPTMGSALDVWSYITREEDDAIAEPSWVVDITKNQDYMYTPMVTAYSSVKPVIERKPEIQFLKENGKELLYIRATVFDTITHLTPFPAYMRSFELQNIPSYRDWLVRLDTVIDDIHNNGIYQPTGESNYNAFWRTLCCNRSSFYAFEPPADGTGYDAFLAHLRIVELRRGHGKKKAWILGIAIAFSSALAYCLRRGDWFLRYVLPLAVPLLAHLYNKTWSKNWVALQVQLQIQHRDFESSQSAWSQGRQFGITKLGLIGLLPVAAKMGDSIGLFQGCRVSYVLMRSGEGYRIVGDAYLHGAMNGEGEQSEGEMLRIL